MRPVRPVDRPEGAVAAWMAKSVMTHAELITAITALADARGLPWHYCPDTRRCKGARGWPDLTIIGSWHALFREVKTEDGRRTREQIAYGFALTEAGLDYAVWRERDLKSGHIEQELDTITSL